MRLKSTVSLLIGAAICLTVGLGYAQDWRIMLQTEDALRLPPEAMQFYNEAVEQVDHVNYDEAVRLLAAAAEKAPDNTELQFLTATRARNRAEIYYSAARFSPQPESINYSSPPWKVAEPFYEIAEQALQRLASSQDLTTEERRRLDAEMRQVEAGRAILSTRDEERMNTAIPVLFTVQRERRQFLGLDEPEDPTELDPFRAYTRPRTSPEAAPAAPGLYADEEEAANPFAPLPGEVTRPFLPTPVPPLPAQYQQGATDEFGNPIAVPPQQPMMDEAVMGADFK